MNKVFPQVQSHAWAVALTCLAMSASVSVSASEAGERPAKFAVPGSQVQALGIQVISLQNQTGSVKSSFPAQVIVPATAEQVVSSPVAGMVAQLLVQQNQLVGVGTPLIRIVSPELGQLQLQLLQATSRATLALQTAQREKQLFDEGIIPERRIQEAQASLNDAQAALQQAKSALLLSGMPAATIARIAASGKPQESIALAARQAGFVTEVAVKPGQRVEAATALLHIAQTDTLWLEVQLPVSESANLPAGSKLEIQGRELTARILSSGAMVASGSQTVTLRAAVDGKSGKLKPGEFVTVVLPAAAMQDTWDVPLSAVAHEGEQAYVFVRTTEGFEARAVKIVASAGQRLTLQSSLKAGEQIAISAVVALKGAWLAAKGSK